MDPQESTKYLDEYFCGLELLSEWYDWHLSTNNGLTMYYHEERKIL